MRMITNDDMLYITSKEEYNMRSIKRITALMLVICITLSLSVTAFAQEPSEVDIRVEDAFVDVSCFTDEALTYPPISQTLFESLCVLFSISSCAWSCLFAWREW